MMRERALVFRLPIDPATGVIRPGVEYVTRSEALFVESEWGWSGLIDEAHVFEPASLAEAHLVTLRGSGEKHAHTRVYTEACARDRAENRSRPLVLPSPRLASPPSSSAPKVSPEEAFSMNERKGLA